MHLPHLNAKLSLAIISALVFANTSHAKDTVHQTEKGSILVSEIANDLQYPWAMAMLPNGELLVTLRDGAMVIVNPENKSKPRTVKNVPKVRAKRQGGLLDVILDNNFEQNNRIYFTFSDPASGGKTGTALGSAVLNNGITPSLSDVKILYSMKNKTRSGLHFGSRIVQAKDGTLFFTIGDRGDSPRAQDPFDPAGSVIRINTDGTLPANNPNIQGKTALREIWSVGHRNPQGATLNDQTGEVWTISHGARGGDEINVPEAGKNYGWPTISYGRHYSGARIGIGTTAPGLEQPVYDWDPSIAPSGLDFYQGNQIPFWKGHLFTGSLKFGQISRLEMDGKRVAHEERLFEGEYGRIRDVRSFPDGALWFLTDSDEGGIYRVTGQ